MKTGEVHDDMKAREKIRQTVDLLRREYAPPEWSLQHDPIEVLVQTILSQNTSDTNSGRALNSLLERFKSWEELADASIDAIERCIRRGGLGKIKAQRIKAALEEILRQRRTIELDFLKDLVPADAETWLTQLPGIGLKTARCVLLFSLGMPSLPVDTHIYRISRRLGLIGQKTSLDEAHRLLGKMVPSRDIYHFHVLLIEHGRKVCHARHPACPLCLLGKICPSYLKV
jgi:endonuclease-3